MGCTFSEDRQDAEVEGIVRHEEGHWDGEQTSDDSQVRPHDIRDNSGDPGSHCINHAGAVEYTNQDTCGEHHGDNTNDAG